MIRRISPMLFVALLTLSACQPARRYPESGLKPVADRIDAKTEAELRRLSWTERQPTQDVPIVFVPESSPDWRKLKGFWNAPPISAVLSHLGQSPLGAAIAVVIAEQQAGVRIKVPRGLPDPTPHVPAVNPPTLGKWRLGQTLFFKPFLKAGTDTYACSSCHDPRYGFTEEKLYPAGGKVNTLSLINVVYNRRQFWDGRVATLEETLVRSFEDERTDPPLSREKVIEQHNWGGFARALGSDKAMVAEFKQVFGIDQPTQNSAAQALATYLRTLLSGNSLYDRADEIRRGKSAKTLTAEHFGAIVKDEASAAGLRNDKDKRTPSIAELPALLQKGYDVFHGKASCVKCHPGPLFTDHDYHNIGYDGPEGAPGAGVETGRSAVVPVGLKEWRLVGAYRTPSLRNLNRTAPYLHNGSHGTLRLVVDFFDGGVLPTLHLAAPLQDVDVSSRVDGRDAIVWPRRLRMTEAEKEGLVLYLRSMQGEPLDGVLLPTMK